MIFISVIESMWFIFFVSSCLLIGFCIALLILLFKAKKQEKKESSKEENKT